MDQKTDNKIDNKTDFKDKLTSLFNSNKIKIYLFISLIIVISFSAIYLKTYNEKQNTLIAEKYIKAGLYLAFDKKKESIKLYKEIIISKNKFYSILALNTILEKDLEQDKVKILEYFETIEELNNSTEQLDLINFKKALYLIKISMIDEGNILLRDLIDNNSNLKILAKEIITN